MREDVLFCWAGKFTCQIQLLMLLVTSKRSHLKAVCVPDSTFSRIWDTKCVPIFLYRDFGTQELDFEGNFLSMTWLWSPCGANCVPFSCFQDFGTQNVSRLFYTENLGHKSSLILLLMPDLSSSLTISLTKTQICVRILSSSPSILICLQKTVS